MKNNKALSQWLTPAEAREFVNVTASTICKAACAGKVARRPADVKGYNYSRDDLVKCFAAQVAVRRQQAEVQTSQGAWIKNPVGVPSDEAALEWLVASKARKLLRSKGKYTLYHLAEKGLIRRRGVKGHYEYARADVLRQRKSPTGSAAVISSVRCAHVSKIPGTQEVILGATASTPRKAVGALLRAKWVFEGVDLGGINASEALVLLRQIIYSNS